MSVVAAVPILLMYSILYGFLSTWCCKFICCRCPCSFLDSYCGWNSISTGFGVPWYSRSFLCCFRPGYCCCSFCCWCRDPLWLESLLLQPPLLLLKTWSHFCYWCFHFSGISACNWHSVFCSYLLLLPTVTDFPTALVVGFSTDSWVPALG